MTRQFLILLLAAMVAACGGGDARQGGGARQTPLVKAETATQMEFADRIEAIGTARANEQVTLAAPVTERIVRLNFDDGAFVRQGQVVAVLRQAEQTAQLTEANARAREATQQLQRVAALKDRGFATRSSYDTQVAAAAAARAQAQQVQAQIGDRVVRAPFAGWVSLRNISVGAIASQGTEIATVSDISTIKLDFTVPETMLASIREGLPIQARSAAYPNQPFGGTIRTIDPVLDPNTRAVTVRALLPNPNRLLRPGMMMNVAIQSSTRMGLSVPELAVLGEGDSQYVFIVGDGNRVHRTAVRTGAHQDGRVEIVAGLRPGQRVVTEGIIKVTDGVQVRLQGQGGQNTGGRNNGGQPSRRGG